MVDMPEILNDVDGESIGQKMFMITSCMRTIAFSAYKTKSDLSKGTLEIDGKEHKRIRSVLDEEYEKWEDRLIAVLQTGIGDWIRGTELWDKFEDAGAGAHSSLVNLIKEQHAIRELRAMELTNNNVDNT